MNFPMNGVAFVHGAGDFTATNSQRLLPLLHSGKTIKIAGNKVYGKDLAKRHVAGDHNAWSIVFDGLQGKDKAFSMSIQPDLANSDAFF